tara:strand:- start:22692 stop:22877 length:186 start_codon:yes stop_codon:yes gene_type:complete
MIENNREKRAKRREAIKRLSLLYKGLTLEELEKKENERGIVQRSVKTRLQQGKIERVNYKI